MDKKDIKKLLKKCFGKEKDDRLHAIAMLIIYGIFIVIVVAIVRLGGNNTNTNTQTTKTGEPTQTSNPVTPTKTPESKTPESIKSDVNYSYSYTITFDGTTEVYLGKKLDSKEKFTLVKDGVSKEYAILDGNYLLLENGKYHIVDKLDNYSKYCDITKILSMIENSIPTESSNSIIYNVTNYEVSEQFGGNILKTDTNTNKVEIVATDGVLKSITLDFSNYISVLLGTNHTLTIKMELANIGTTENFEIKLD